MGLLLSGKNPAAYKTAERTYFTATAGQTTFTLPNGYAPGDIDVFLNGVRLVESDDYFAINGSTVVLTAAASAGDHLAIVCYYQFQAAGSWTKAESDNRYMTASGTNPMTSYLRTPNYGISSTSDSLSASLEASAFAGEQGVGIKAFGRSVATSGGSILYTADNRGASGAHKFGFWNGTSFTTTMNIDSVGRLTLPNQAIMVLDGNGSTQTVNGVITSMSAVVSRGGMTWSGGRVTVPVSGLYRMSLQVYHYQTGSVRTTINVNGTETTLAHSANANTADETRYQSTIRYLSANDYVDFRTTSNVQIYTGSRHTYAVVELIG